MWRNLLTFARGLGNRAKRTALAWFSTTQAKIVLVLVLLVAILFWRLNVARNEMREAIRQAEAGKLRLAGLLVAEQRTNGELRDRYAAALKQNEALAGAAEKARASGAGKPVEVVHEETGPRPVEPGTGTDACVLRLGELGEIKRDAVAFQTEAGNRTLVAELSAWRSAGPRPPARLFGGIVSVPLSKYEVARENIREPSSLGGWAWGLSASAAGGNGIAPGIAISPPPFGFPIFGGSGFFVGTVGSTPNGKFQGTISILRRGGG